MSEPITINVRDLTAEHIGWTMVPSHHYAGQLIFEIHHRGSVTEIHLSGGDVLTLDADREYGGVTQILPPPPHDPWEGVPMPEAWVVQVLYSDGDVFAQRYADRSFARGRAAGLSAGALYRAVRIVHLSADGAEVVE